MQTFWAIVTCFQATYNEQFFSNASVVSESSHSLVVYDVSTLFDSIVECDLI